MTETHDGARFIWRDKDCTAYGDLGGALCKLGTEQDALDDSSLPSSTDAVDVDRKRTSADSTELRK